MRLTQIVANVVNNATKYTRSGGQIQVAAMREGTEVVIRVRDNGIGIAKSMLPRVFDLYAQERTARASAQDGLGIGLTVVRRLVELHGGRVAVRSDGIDAGSEFVIHLPLAAAVESNGAAIARPPLELPPGRPLRILVVDDNEDAADSLALLLSLSGHEVRTAYDGARALATARSFSPEVTLQDVGMPDMDGYEVARKLRELRETQQATLIALTGFSRPEDARQALAAGFHHHLSKPVDFGVLDSLLRAL